MGNLSRLTAEVRIGPMPIRPRGERLGPLEIGGKELEVAVPSLISKEDAW